MASEREEGQNPQSVGELKSRPVIMVFDSGVGGLSVYDEIRQLLPDAQYLYVFDNAGFPYGEKPNNLLSNA